MEIAAAAAQSRQQPHRSVADRLGILTWRCPGSLAGLVETISREEGRSHDQRRV